MQPTWATLAGVVLTGLFAWAASAWAKRGDKQISAGDLAIQLVGELKERVERLEGIEAWRAICATIDADHIGVLRDHIYRQLPPPPPERPIYPSRPA